MLQKFLEQKLTLKRSIDRTYNSFETRIRILNRMFEMPAQKFEPASYEPKGSYRVCIDCGAHTMFDKRNFKTLGDYYYPDR